MPENESRREETRIAAALRKHSIYLCATEHFPGLNKVVAAAQKRFWVIRAGFQTSRNVYRIFAVSLPRLLVCLI